jgi:hypothetical protein
MTRMGRRFREKKTEKQIEVRDVLTLHSNNLFLFYLFSDQNKTN